MNQVFESVKEKGSEEYLLLVHPDDYDRLDRITKISGHDKIQYFRSHAVERGKITVIARQMLEKESPGAYDLWREQLEEREKAMQEADNENSEK